MRRYEGIVVNTGIVIGRVFSLEEPDLSYDVEKVNDVDKEIERLTIAVSNTAGFLDKLKGEAEKTHGSSCTDTLSTHILLLTDKEDESLIQRCKEYIKTNRVNAEYAVEQSGKAVVEEFLQSDSDYRRARSEDIQQLIKMLLAELLGKSTFAYEMKAVGENAGGLYPNSPSIIVANELSPEVLSSISPDCILGIVTKRGSRLSHTAILAANLNIPYLTGVKFESVLSGTMAVIDGNEKAFIVEPDSDFIQKTEERIKEGLDKQLLAMTNSEEVIKNSPIKLFANIGKPDEVSKALECHAQGIGLLRSEFLYMDRLKAPSEDEQLNAYVKVLEAMKGKVVTIRTIDLGADKEANCVAMPQEPNPALGTRGIRISFANPKLFKTQLRALLRAAYGRNLRIMFPMIASEWELKKAVEEVNTVARELETQGKEYRIPDIGIMVETPAAVLILDKLAPYVKFVSIGTNDLTQYTLALDRVNDGLTEYLNPHHEAILKLIEMTAKSAHNNNIEVGICGELGADPELAEHFVRMGIDEISMACSKILPLALALKNCKKTMCSQELVAPVSGVLVNMEEIPDETFSKGLLGSCLGIIPDSDIIFAPCSGEISMVAATGHAFSIKKDTGDEILIHVGIDTVELGGEGFENKLKVGQRVSCGEQLMIFNKDTIVKAGFSPMVVIVRLA